MLFNKPAAKPFWLLLLLFAKLAFCKTCKAASGLLLAARFSKGLLARLAAGLLEANRAWWSGLAGLRPELASRLGRFGLSKRKEG